MSTGKKVFAAVVITVIAMVVIIAAWNTASDNVYPTADLKLAANQCSFSADASSADYSATVTASKDYGDTVSSIKTLLAKYNADTLSWNTSVDPYQSDDASGTNIYVTSSVVSATIAINDAQAFMNDLPDSINASDTLVDPSYSKTTGPQLSQECIDDLNNVQQSQMLAQLYLREIPDAESNYVPAGTDTNDGTTESNLDNIYQDVQNAYGNANSYNDSLASLLQNLNRMSVTITIQATDTPASYVSPTPAGTDDSSDSSGDSGYE